MRVTSKGQVTIPRDLRQLAGIELNSDVLFGVENGKITIVYNVNYTYYDSNMPKIARVTNANNFENFQVDYIYR